MCLTRCKRKEFTCLIKLNDGFIHCDFGYAYETIVFCLGKFCGLPRAQKRHTYAEKESAKRA